MPLDFAISALLTLFVVVDPVGLTPTFLAITQALPRAARRSVAVRASLIAGAHPCRRRADRRLAAPHARTSRCRRFASPAVCLLFSIAFEMVFGVRMPP